MAWHLIMSLCVARTEKVGRSVAVIKGTSLTWRSYGQRVKAWGGYRHVCVEWEQRVCLRSGGPAVSRENQHPQLGWEKPAAEWGTWCLENRPNRPCALLGASRFTFDPIRWWKSCTYIATFGSFWFQVQAGLSLWGNPSSPHRKLVWGSGEQDENCPWWRQTPLKRCK